MNGVLLAFFMCTPINQTWDPDSDIRVIGREAYIHFIDVNLPLQEYYMDCNDEYCCNCLEEDQLEELNKDYYERDNGDEQTDTEGGANYIAPISD